MSEENTGKINSVSSCASFNRGLEFLGVNCLHQWGIQILR